MCDSTNQSIASLQRPSSTNKPVHICTFEDCDKTFRDLRSFKEHIMVHKGEKPYTCYLPSCAKQFTRIASLQKHERIHKGQKPYSCSECGQTFSQGCNLKRHMRMHSGYKPFNCEICKKNFITHANLKQHMITHQKKDDREKFTCKLCDRSYYYKNSMKKHMEDSHGYRDSKANNSTDDSKTMETEDEGQIIVQKPAITFEDKAISTTEDEFYKLLKYVDASHVPALPVAKAQEKVNPNEIHTFLHINLQYHIHVLHEDHLDFLYQNNLYHLKPQGYDIHRLEITDLNPNICKPVLELSHFPDYEALDKLYRDFLSKHSGTISRDLLQSSQVCNSLNCFCSTKCASKKTAERASVRNIVQPSEGKSCCQKKPVCSSGGGCGKEETPVFKKFSDRKSSTNNGQGFTKYQKGDCKSDCKPEVEEPEKDNTKQECCRSLMAGEECICCDTAEMKHVHNENCGHVSIWHGDHIDYVVEGRLHHIHGTHCDDHGELKIISHSNPIESKLDLLDYSTY